MTLSLFRRKGTSAPTPVTVSEEHETAAPKEPQSVSPVTRAEFNALTKRVHALTTTVGAALAKVELARRRDGFADGTISYQLRHYAPDSLTPGELAVLKQVVKAFDATMDVDRRLSEQRETIRQGGRTGLPF